MSTRRARIKAVASIPVRKKTTVVKDESVRSNVTADSDRIQDGVVQPLENKQEIDQTSTRENVESGEIKITSQRRQRIKCIVANIPIKKAKDDSKHADEGNVSAENSLKTESKVNTTIVEKASDRETSSSFLTPDRTVSTDIVARSIKPNCKEGIKNSKDDILLNSPPFELLDPIIPLQSSSKNRLKLRPVPLFSPRRNSIHDSASETEDDSKRIKNDESHYITQTFTAPLTPNTPVTPNSNRYRNDSVSSAYNDQISSTIPRLKNKPSVEPTKKSTIRKRILNRAPQGPLTMSDLIYYNPPNNPMKSLKSPKNELQLKNEALIKSDSIKEDSNEIEVKESNVMPVPQVKLGPNGEIIIDEQSLVIETTDSAKSKSEISKLAVVYENGPGSGGIYRRAIRSKDWSNSETLRFYKALNRIGTDFALMLPFFPGRTRKDLKVKFKREEKHNLKLIDKALLNPINFDITELKQQLSNEQSTEKKKKEKIKTAPKKRDYKKRKSLAYKYLERHFEDTDSRNDLSKDLNEPIPVIKKTTDTSIKENIQRMQGIPEENSPIMENSTSDINEEEMEIEDLFSNEVFTNMDEIKSSNGNRSDKSKPPLNDKNNYLSNENLSGDIEPGSMVILVNEVPEKVGYNTLQAYIAKEIDSKIEVIPIELEFNLLLSIAKEMNILKADQNYIPTNIDSISETVT